MTKRQLKSRFLMTVIIYMLVIVSGVLLVKYGSGIHPEAYSVYKDLIPFFIAIPAAWLGYSIQRRNSYLQQLRLLWSELIEAVQVAKQYTFIESPTYQEYAQVLQNLSQCIDEVRGVFKNLGEKDNSIGLYPFEPIKMMHELMKVATPDNMKGNDIRMNIRDHLFKLWKGVRIELLKEFDREEPTFPHSFWKNNKQYKVLKGTDDFINNFIEKT